MTEAAYIVAISVLGFLVFVGMIQRYCARENQRDREEKQKARDHKELMAQTLIVQISDELIDDDDKKKLVHRYVNS